MFRAKLLNAAYPILQRMGTWHMPWTHKRVAQSDVEIFLQKALPGDIFLMTKHGELTNLVIPGDHTHVAMYCPRWIHDLRPFVEAVSPAVRRVGLYDLLLKQDLVSLVRPKLGKDQAQSAAILCATFIGRPYDFQFDLPASTSIKNDAFYCAEMPHWCYLKAAAESYTFVVRDIFGVETIAPDDYWNAPQHFDRIWSTKGSTK